MNVRKVINAFFTIFLPKGKYINAKFYESNILHKKGNISKRQPATGCSGVRLLHDNASSHKAILERENLKQENAFRASSPSLFV